MVYELGAIVYKSKASVVKRVRQILKDTKANTQLTGDDEAFVRDLLRLHPRRGQTKAVERDLFVVYSQRSTKDKCFAYWSDRKGKPIDFSYKECISPSSAIQRFSEACRDAVVSDVLRFKREFWTGKRRATCPITGVIITRNSSHVDHASPCFAELVDRFISEHAIDFTTVTYRGNGFAKMSLVESFREFHREHASLQIISVQANLSKNSGGYKRAA